MEHVGFSIDREVS